VVLSDSQFQQISGLIGHLHSMLSRMSLCLSDNQPYFQQNTLPIRQPRLYTGQSLVSAYYFSERSTQVSLQQSPSLPQKPTLFTASRQPFPSIAAALPPSAINTPICRRFLSPFFVSCPCSELSNRNFPLLLLFTLHFPLFRNNSPSTAAAPPLAAAITPVCCGKLSFFGLLPQLSSPTATKKRIHFRFAFVFTLHFALFFPPIVWRDWKLYATKTHYLPQNR
jgi:hypothetical protein